MTPILFLLTVFAIAALIAGIYEFLSIRYHLWPTITYEIRLGERTFPVVYMAVMFALGACRYLTGVRTERMMNAWSAG